MTNIINFKEKFALINQYWTPKIVGELNGQYIKLAKFKGEFVWHSHELEDEFFQVIEGQVTIHLCDRLVTINPGECFIVPKGVEHKPEAKQEAWVMMFEPKNTAHTGDIDSELTVKASEQEWL